MAQERTLARAEMLRIDLDPRWSRLTDKARETASAWVDVARRMDAATDKAAELLVCRELYAPILGAMSRTTVYRRVAAITTFGLEGAVSKSDLKRAQGGADGTTLPVAFVEFWQGLCGQHQRRKTLAVWRHLMRDWLIAGKIIPGYATDWRGIWAAEWPGCIAPDKCPYTAIHAGPGANAPRGWGYRTLLSLAPDEDVWRGATIGVHAMQAYNPSIPHTRVGLRPMQVITMDDVTLDAFCWFPGENAPRRPVGLGVLDVYTANMVSWGLVPVRKRDDGTSAKLDGLKRRYIDAHIFCGLGIDPAEGVTMLLEHGTAGMDQKEEDRINGILGARPDGEPWLRVRRSSTSGAPILKGMFRERGRGRPTHKAMLEAAWNLLHNEMAALPAPSGKDWDNAPQDQQGWEAEDRALIKACSELLARECPGAVEALVRARTHALTYSELDASVREVIARMNGRRGHALEGWEGCGFVRPMVEVGGATVDLGAAARDMSGGDAEMEARLLSTLAGKAMPVRMSPVEAWLSATAGRQLKRWSPFVATRILGPETAQRVTVNSRRQFTAVDEFSGEALLYSARCVDEVGRETFLQAGDSVDVWLNPFSRGMAFVCRPAGEWVGAAAYMPATAHGSDAGRGNMIELAKARAEQRDRLRPVVALKQRRESARRETNEAAQIEAGAAPDREAERLVAAIAAQADDAGLGYGHETF